MSYADEKCFVVVRDPDNPNAKIRFMEFANKDVAKAYIHDTTVKHPSYVLDYI